MATLSDRSLSILKDACGIHDLTEIEQARMEVLADQINEILTASKEREKQKHASK